MRNKSIILLVFFFCFFVQAQNNEPKVGLVLSGGGAKGFAHIGVLKVIDSLNIKVDYVAGTSMGAIIGALYASGYSGKELDSIFEEINFDNLINDRLPRTSKGPHERENSEKYGLTLPFDDFKFKLPSALSKGHNIFYLLSKLTYHVKEIEDFKKLPIPFFCIATNVEIGKQVILEKGNLPQAILASGALPSLFQPLTLNGDMLVDGGVINNYPVDEMRAKGIDFIIGVDVQDDLQKRDKLQSAPDVLLQISNFSTVEVMEVKKELTDIYIKPDIKDYTMISFGDGAKIIQKGKYAAIKSLDKLKALPQKNLKLASEVKKHPDSITINNFVFNGNKNYSRAYIRGKLRLKTSEKISFKDLEKGISNLVATNNFDSFHFDLKDSKGAEGDDLSGKLIESKNKMFLKLGAHYDNLYKSGALINLTKKRFVFKNDETSLDVVLGNNLRYNFEYFIDNGFYWSVGFRSRYNTFNKNLNAELLLNDREIDIVGVNKINAQIQDITNQFYMQTLFKKNFVFGLGAEHKYLNIKSETVLNTITKGDFVFESTHYVSAFGYLKFDSYDNKFFPKSGVYFNGNFNTYLFSLNLKKNPGSFSIAKADMGYAFSLTNKLAFNLKTSGGFTIGSNSSQALDFALGGYGNNFINNYISFIGYDFISLFGDSYVKATAITDFEIFKNQHITLEANIANVGDDIFGTADWFKLPSYSGYGLGYALETFFGPVQLKYTYTPEQKQGIWFFNLGFWF